MSRARRAPGVVSAVAMATLAALPTWADRAGGQEVPEAWVRDTVSVPPQGRYDAPWLQRFFLGAGHRNLWSLPMEAVVLDLDAWAGGLTVDRRGGGLQTRSLRFQGADGRDWRFRSVDKDATRSLDPELRATIAGSVMQDRISALLPASAAVVDPLLEAADVLHARPTLVVMPDDPRLGEHRADFAGTVGWMEVQPDEGPDDTPGFAGSSRVIGSPAFLERIEDDPAQHVDAEAYLRARLMDMYVGDWDRHPDQWRWAGFADPRGLRFEPVPRDRDWALSRLDGVVGSVSWAFWPHYVGFQHDYPSPFRASWSARVLDRRLLSELPGEAYHRVAADLQARLTDATIQAAVDRLPPSYPQALRQELLDGLLHRRDDLIRFAGDWYTLLAGWVDVHATDRDELAVVEWTDDGGARVRIHPDTAGTAPPYLERHLLPDETRELRLYMHGGDDRVRVQGPGRGRIRVRVIGGGGDDAFENRSEGGGRVYFYDHRGDNTFDPGPGARVDEDRFVEPFDPAETTHQAPFRDWGARWIPLPGLSYDVDQGLFLSVGGVRTGYGFRYYPHHTRLYLNGGIGSRPGRFRAELRYDFPLTGRKLRAEVDAYASGADANRFYGFGNETTAEGDSDRFQAQRREIRLQTPVTWHAGTGTRLSFGPVLKHFEPFDTEGTLIEEQQPYGFESFTQVGVNAGLEVDTRDRRLVTTRGVLLRAEGRAFARALSVREEFGGVRGSIAAFFTLPGRMGPTLAARLGGEATFGDVPYQEAAYLGGLTDLRGYRTQRFVGRRSVYVNAEVRLPLGSLKILVPGDVGLYALGDVGRVFVEGESSSVWHPALGGGAWITIMDVANLNLSVAVGEEQTLFYFVSGFAF